MEKVQWLHLYINYKSYLEKKVHVYRSPHLISFNERIIVANKIISDQKLYKLLLYVYQVNNNEILLFLSFLLQQPSIFFQK